ncbi:response regulator [Sulfitobacter sp. F26204]|uniref:response regulator transcription factor n=1 Tax=Sulfitobacter sp. F26204 TaxID=2996014 RepID=UPI00225E3BDB|nr:response regulator [Sulfitobacter sp. F26204]MCX7560203.1 response regulator [Sulfitobacter sp. F26204]
MHILVVDDDAIMLDLLAATLTKEEGYQLEMHTSAESGLEALANSEHQFDCMLLDIMLPGMNGIEMCNELRKSSRHSTTPILMITGSVDLQLMARAFEVGATDFIHKPFDPQELTARVKMAGLLNQSLAKAQHTMSALADRLKIRFDEPLDLGIDKMCTPLALENELLRYRAECFAMTMFSIDIFSMRGIYRAVRASAFRSCLEIIGEAAVEAFGERNFRLAYIGKGRFIGAFMDRQRFDSEEVNDRLNAELEEAWDTNLTGVPMAPKGRLTALSAQRIWSGISASDALRQCQTQEAGLGDLTPTEENDLFARLDNKLPQATGASM